MEQNIVMKPWVPIELTTNDNDVVAKVWGRSYKSGTKSFLESILSQGQS